MIQIAICDDNMNFTGKLEKLLLRIACENAIQVEIDVFFDGSTLKECMIQGNRYDLIYLEIKFKKLCGIELAKEIRRIDQTVLFIYISAHEQYLKKLFELETFRFLSKPLDEQLFVRYFLEACHYLRKNIVYFRFSHHKELFKVPIQDILYFESHARMIYIHLVSGETEQFYGKLTEVEEKLAGSNVCFLRIHQSYLVNYAYIYKMNFTNIILRKKNGKAISLKISEDRQKNVRFVLEHLIADESLYRTEA